ncbi:hypothetical protein [Pseudomonas sp. Marseille-QA0332]
MENLPSQGSTSWAKMRSICDRVLAAGFQVQRLEVAPGLEDASKGVQGCGQLCRLEMQTVNTRIDIMSHLRAHP